MPGRGTAKQVFQIKCPKPVNGFARQVSIKWSVCNRTKWVFLIKWLVPGSRTKGGVSNKEGEEKNPLME